MIQQFNRLTEVGRPPLPPRGVCVQVQHPFTPLFPPPFPQDKADVQSILGVQRFFQERLSAAFRDRNFSTLLDPTVPMEGAEGAAAAPPAPLPAPPVAP